MQPKPIDTRGFYVDVGEKVRIARKKLGMDQEAFARHLGLNRTTVINIEKGRQRLSLEQAWLAAQILHVTISSLLPPVRTLDISDWKRKVESNQGIASKSKSTVMDFITSAKINK